jgi:hypothetical protein
MAGRSRGVTYVLWYCSSRKNKEIFIIVLVEESGDSRELESICFFPKSEPAGFLEWMDGTPNFCTEHLRNIERLLKREFYNNG